MFPFGMLASRKEGLSLIEIMIVLSILSLVMSIVGVSFSKQAELSKIRTAIIQSKEIGKALDIYKHNTDKYPSMDVGLSVLTDPENGYPVMDSIPLDPWGEQYVYMYPGNKNLDKPDIISKGPDGKLSEDDIGNWSK